MDYALAGAPPATGRGRGRAASERRWSAFAAEQRLGEHRAKGMLFRGWAQALLGDVPGGLQEMRDALAWEEEAGTPEDFPLYYEMFAEVCERAGRFDEGLDAVSKGFAQAERGRLVYWNAELPPPAGRAPARRGRSDLAARWPTASSTP